MSVTGGLPEVVSPEPVGASDVAAVVLGATELPEPPDVAVGPVPVPPEAPEPVAPVFEPIVVGATVGVTTVLLDEPAVPPPVAAVEVVPALLLLPVGAAELEVSLLPTTPIAASSSLALHAEAATKTTLHNSAFGTPACTSSGSALPNRDNFVMH